MKRLRITTVVLVVANVALACGVVLLWKWGQARVTEPVRLNVPPLALPDLTALNSVSMPSVEVATIREQAAFYASRVFYRPPVAPVQVQPPEYEIGGTLRLADGKRIAFVKKKSDQSSRTLHVGDDLEGWRVQLIDSDRILLDQGVQTVVLRNGASGSGASGLIRGASVPHTVQTGIRVLGATGSGGLQSPGQAGAREARLYRPPPVGK